MKKLENPTPAQLKHREYMKEYYHRRVFEHICKTCGKPFVSKNYRAKNCTAGCAHKRRISKVCLWCKKPYTVIPAWEKRHISKYCSRSCMGQYRRGELSPQWKGGTSSERERWQSSLAHRKWRTAVLERDDYTCQECGTKDGWLQVHHIKPWAYHPESRTDIDNGLTLCVPCHKETDTYGSKAKIYGKTLTTREVY